MSKGYEGPQAVGKWVVIEPVNRIPGMQNGIVIPDAVQESLKADVEPAIIVSAGEDCSKRIEPGKTAYVLHGSCLTLPLINGKSLLTCPDHRVVAVV